MTRIFIQQPLEHIGVSVFTKLRSCGGTRLFHEPNITMIQK